MGALIGGLGELGETLWSVLSRSGGSEAADSLWSQALKNGNAEKIFKRMPDNDLHAWKEPIEAGNTEALSDLRNNLGEAGRRDAEFPEGNYRGLLDTNTKLTAFFIDPETRAERIRNKPVEQDFTVAPEHRAKGVQELTTDDFQFQWNNVQKAWDEAAKLKPGSEDFLSRSMTLGPINSTQIKGWVKSAEAKMKSELKREGGAETYLDEKGIPRSTVEDMPYFELHHELIKKLYAAYMLQVKALYEAGKITKLDVINFNHLAHEMGGFGMGDYGVVGYPRAVHSDAHAKARKAKIEPTGKALKTKVEEVTNFDNINDLTADFKKSIKEISLPMRRQLNLSQRAYDSIPVWDQQKIFQLYRKRDRLKYDLKDSVLPDFEASGLKPPKKGGGNDLLDELRERGGIPSQRTLEIEQQIIEAQKVAEDYLAEVKSRIGVQEGKDIQMDVQKGISRDRPGKGVGQDPNSAEGVLQEQSVLQDYLSEPTELTRMADEYAPLPTDPDFK